MSRNVEAEAAILAGIMGFFIGGIVSFALRREMIEVFTVATVSGVAVFVLGYYAILLITQGKIPSGTEKKVPAARPQQPEPGTADKKEPFKGKKIDVVTEDKDDIFKDIYKTK